MPFHSAREQLAPSKEAPFPIGLGSITCYNIGKGSYWGSNGQGPPWGGVAFLGTLLI